MWFGDLEADGLLEEATTIWCGVFKNADTGEIRKFSPADGPGYLTGLRDFVASCSCLCFHNGIGFDFPILKRLLDLDFKGEKVDTLLLSRLFRPNRRRPPRYTGKGGPHSIEAWGFRMGRLKPEHEDWSAFSEAMLHRCTEDVEILEAVYPSLQKEAAGFNWTNAVKLTHRLFEILEEQERYGWLFDQDHAATSLRRLSKWIERIDIAVNPYLPNIVVVEEQKKGDTYGFVRKPFKKNGDYCQRVADWIDGVGLGHLDRPVRGPFTRIAFRKTNLNSDKEIKEFLLAEGWEPKEYNFSKTTGERTSPKLSQHEEFVGVNSKVGGLIVKRVQCRHRHSQIEGWFKRLRPDGRIPSRVTGLAVTGRATHANIVNVPGPDSFFGKEMRQCFICKEGYSIVGTDSAGCQNRMLAARVGDEFFTRTLLEGSKEDKTSIHYVNIRAIKEKTGLDVGYHDAKTINYATLFGGRGKKVGGIVNKDAAFGDQIREAIFGVAPGFQDLVDNITAEWRSHAKRRRGKYGHLEWYDGWITGLDGRPLFIDSEHKLLVFLLQSDEAIMMATALCFLYKWATEKFGPHGDKWGLLIWYHDEFQAEVRDDIAEEFARVAELAIETAGRFYKIACPHKGESDIGKNWFETH